MNAMSAGLISLHDHPLNMALPLWQPPSSHVQSSIDATDADISLVLVGGEPVAGDVSAKTDTVTLAVTLSDFGKIPPAIRDAAEQQLARIFGAAGVEIRPVLPGVTAGNECPTIEVVLLSDAMARRLLPPKSIPPNSLGIVGSEIHRAYVFVDRVLPLALHNGADPGDLLGNVIAHEIGHLLLPDEGHSPGGIMQAEFEMHMRGARRFTPAQAEAIRKFLRGEPRRCGSVVG